MRIINIIISVIAAIFLAVYSISIGAILLIRGTVINEEYILKKADEVNLYQLVEYKIKDSITSSGLAGALSAQFIDDIISDDMIKTEVNNIITSIYHNTKYQPNADSLTEQISNSFYDILNEYNVPSLNTVDNLVAQGAEMVVEQYVQAVSSVQTQLIGDYLNKIAVIGDRSLPFTILIAILSLSLIIFINFKNKKYIMRYITIGQIAVLSFFTVMLSRVSWLYTYFEVNEADAFAKSFILYLINVFIKDLFVIFIFILIFILLLYVLYAPVRSLYNKSKFIS